LDNANALPISPQRLTAENSVLLLIDVQEKLISAIPPVKAEELVPSCAILLQAASLLDVEVVATEQYPSGLGPTVEPLASQLQELCDSPPLEKKTFSCGVFGEKFDALREAGKRQIVLAGIETHVCVLQTALDLLAAGWEVQLVIDASASRREADYVTAICRLEASGAFLTTTETVLFEWCGTAERDEFKEISSLIRSRN